ncbi:MAG: primosomal protein N' [Succinivibrio sp.]|nr:primosomal protein N' [Succinivibrio sp.]
MPYGEKAMPAMTTDNFTYIEVAVNRPLWKSFLYKTAASVSHKCLGARVKVNFAGADQIGIITSILKNIEDDSKIKTATLLDPEGLISEDVLNILKFGSTYYHYPLGQCLGTATPKILREGGKCDYEKIPALELADPDVDTSKIRSSEQLKIIEILKKGITRRKELRDRGFSSSSENALIKKGIANLVNQNIVNENWQTLCTSIIKETPPTANMQQQNAINTISACHGFNVFLLNGITGSGKTEVYLRVIENTLTQGKAALVLVPEIALTPQTFDRFYRRFNVPVASMHSAMTDRERLDSYLDMKTGKAAILIGTRTALFTPIPNLGLIVIDEEHDLSFKQTDGFRYHARALAILRAKENQCPIILGSATPSLESYYCVEQSKYTQLNLTQRAGNADLPFFNVIDLRDEKMTEGLNTGIGETLENRIGEETAKGNQVLLFLNRRGYSHHLVCHSCGKIINCPNCDIPLTVHKNDNRLRCHICEYSTVIPKQCPGCSGTDLLESGFGTEQVEEFLKARYPDLEIERIDRDTVSNKKALEVRLEKFKKGIAKIIIGTQMIAKGHDFPNVTLVGIIDIDSNIYSDDFRSTEYVAQLLTQVSGRAGRASKKGVVIIQTHHPEEQLINQIISPESNYSQIAHNLLTLRKQIGLPPYTSQAYVLVNSPNREKAHSLILSIYDQLANCELAQKAVTVFPIMSDKIEKRQNRYHFHILLSSDSKQKLSKILDFASSVVATLKPSNDVRFAIEVDPLIMY